MHGLGLEAEGRGVVSKMNSGADRVLAHYGPVRGTKRSTRQRVFQVRVRRELRGDWSFVMGEGGAGRVRFVFML